MKNLYVTLVASDEYILGAICLNKSLQKVKSKYPFLVLLTTNCSSMSKKLLEQNNIKYKEVLK